MTLEQALILAADHFREWFADDYAGIAEWTDFRTVSQIPCDVTPETVQYGLDAGEMSDEHAAAYLMLLNAYDELGDDGLLLHSPLTSDELTDAIATVASSERTADEDEELAGLSDVQIVQHVLATNSMPEIRNYDLDSDDIDAYAVVFSAHARGENIADYV